MQRRNIIAVILGVIGGVLLIYSGYQGATAGFWGWAIQFVINLNLNPLLTQVLMVVLSIITFLSFLGGWTVLAGTGLLVLRRHRLAFYVMGIGAGLSLMSLVWNIIQLWLFQSFTIQAFLARYQGFGWLGAILAVIAQEFIQVPSNEEEKKEKKKK